MQLQWTTKRHGGGNLETSSEEVHNRGREVDAAADEYATARMRLNLFQDILHTHPDPSRPSMDQTIGDLEAALAGCRTSHNAANVIHNNAKDQEAADTELKVRADEEASNRAKELADAQKDVDNTAENEIKALNRETLANLVRLGPEAMTRLREKVEDLDTWAAEAVAAVERSADVMEISSGHEDNGSPDGESPAGEV